MGAFTIEALKVPTCCFFKGANANTYGALCVTQEMWECKCFFKGANANTYGAWCVNTRNVRI